MSDEKTAQGNVARAVVTTVRLMRDGGYERPDRGLLDPRPK